MKKLLPVLLFIPAIVLLYFGIFVWDTGVISNTPTTTEETTVISTIAASTAATATSHTPATGAFYDNTTVPDSTTITAPTTAADSHTTGTTTATTAKSSATTTTTKPATTEAATAERTNACTLTIDSTAAGQGYFLQNYHVTVEDGDTAYDILSRACQENGISVNASPTGYGIYVAGINGLDQKEIGDNSGWMYYVNGIAPQKAVSKYKIKPGDTVLFYYTVDYSTP